MSFKWFIAGFVAAGVVLGAAVGAVREVWMVGREARG